MSREYPSTIDLALCRSMWTLPKEVKNKLVHTQMINFPLKNFLDMLDDSHAWKVSFEYDNYNFQASFYNCSLDQLEEAAEIPDMGDKFIIRASLRRYNDLYNLGIGIVRLFYPNPNPAVNGRVLDAVDKLLLEEAEPLKVRK